MEKYSCGKKLYGLVLALLLVLMGVTAQAKGYLPLFFMMPEVTVQAKGNARFDSFNDAKRFLERSVYRDHRSTFYCQAQFDMRKNIKLPKGFTSPAHAGRMQRLEWEHIVPAENFGRTFAAWREGHSSCVDNHGKAFKGRSCAEKFSPEYRYMQADLHNLQPAIGAVNALRSNYNFTQLASDTPATFGTCPMKILGNKVEPPEYTRGPIARTYLYMAWAYPEHFRMSDQQVKLMQAWDKMHPVSAWECEREKRISRLQGNENPFVRQGC